MTILIRAFALAVFSIVPFVALAQHSAAAASTAYTPPLSDLMLIAQLRHIKVWLAEVQAIGRWLDSSCMSSRKVLNTRQKSTQSSTMARRSDR